MDNLLNIIEDNKENLPNGMYLDLMNELKKMYNEQHKYLVKMYCLKFINKKEDNMFYIDTEEVLYKSGVLDLSSFDINIENGETYYDVRENPMLYTHIISKLRLEIEDVEYLENDEYIWYTPIPIRFTFTKLN